MERRYETNPNQGISSPEYITRLMRASERDSEILRFLMEIGKLPTRSLDTKVERPITP